MMNLFFQKFFSKPFDFYIFLSNNIQNMIAETFLFSLSTKGIKFGSFNMSAVENVNQYNISSNFESSGILGIFTKIEGRVEHTEQFK